MKYAEEWGFLKSDIVTVHPIEKPLKTILTPLLPESQKILHKMVQYPGLVVYGRDFELEDFEFQIKEASV